MEKFKYIRIIYIYIYIYILKTARDAGEKTKTNPGDKPKWKGKARS
jgi:hypothetical protein